MTKGREYEAIGRLALCQGGHMKLGSALKRQRANHRLQTTHISKMLQKPQNSLRTMMKAIGQLADLNVGSVLEIHRGRYERWTKEQEYEAYVEISTPPITFASSEETMASTSGPLMPTT